MQIVVTKKSSVDDAIYCIEFKRDAVSINQLKKLKYLLRTAVEWKPYIRKNKGQPTQCWNCLMYGHGGRNCHRTSACATCGGNGHTNIDCPLKDKDPETILVKCFNCLHKGLKEINHRANDRSCPSRQEYVNIRTKMSNKNNRNPVAPSNNYQFDERDFPATIGNSNAPPQNHFIPNQGTYSSQFKKPQRDSLFDMNELFEIFTSAINELESCTSKLQQMKVLAKLLKHATD